MRYFAKFKKEKEGGYSVSFPSLKGCFSEGDSFEEAKTMATEALSLWLESALEYNEVIPAPKEFTGKEYVAIEVPACIAVAIQLRKERGKRSIEEMAHIVQNYEKFEQVSNPTLRSLEKVANALGKRLEVNFA
ncbi:MAG: type II toxin-antitoxin system HicB family antitoxin [Candidatus Fibromonas sp.]|jgi:predicted RNase H-like HicB family nuclease|nr:type II toxin-antitoxin system HicB family antitoxin [Candidatus Fibromonas sp.]